MGKTLGRKIFCNSRDCLKHFLQNFKWSFRIHFFNLTTSIVRLTTEQVYAKGRGQEREREKEREKMQMRECALLKVCPSGLVKRLKNGCFSERECLSVYNKTHVAVWQNRGWRLAFVLRKCNKKLRETLFMQMGVIVRLESEWEKWVFMQANVIERVYLPMWISKLVGEI